jgi:hypothetical protein
MKKKLLCLIAAICLIMPAPVSGQSAAEFVTTGDPLRVSVFTAEGNRIRARGFYEGEVVAAFSVIYIGSSTPLQNVSEFALESDGNGAYNAVFEGSPPAGSAPSSAYRIRVTLANGDALNYRVYYNNGWHFGDSDGLAPRHVNVVENYTPVSAAVAAQYLVGDGTRTQARETLDTIRRLAVEITAGLYCDYAKARAISGWVADNIFYDRDARDAAETPELITQTIALSNVLETRRTICSGYANLTAALLGAIDIKAVTVVGSAVSLADYEVILTETRHHEWTAFWYESENRWVMLDSGWDSWNYHENNNFVTRAAPRRYFDITAQAFAQTHRPIRAEYRDYFAILQQHEFPGDADDGSFIFDYEPWTPPETSPAATNDDGESDNLLPLYIATGVLATAVLVTVAVLVFQKRRD